MQLQSAHNDSKQLLIEHYAAAHLQLYDDVISSTA
jgi:hypothetical protein